MADNIYDALRESHATQRSLCRRLLRAKAGDTRRSELFQALRVELAAHAAAEERFLYAPILMDDMGLSPSRHALSEHLYVVDPMGNWMMRFPALMDASGAGKAKRDLERLLRASSSWDDAGRPGQP